MKGSKGLELPINVIVVVAIAILVLVVAAALFTTNVSSQQGTLQLEQAYAQGCQTLRSVYNCASSGLSSVKTNYVLPGKDPNVDANKLSLLGVCQQKNWDTNACLRNCGCPAPA